MEYDKSNEATVEQSEIGKRHGTWWYHDLEICEARGLSNLKGGEKGREIRDGQVSFQVDLERDHLTFITFVGRI